MSVPPTPIPPAPPEPISPELALIDPRLVRTRFDEKESPMFDPTDTSQLAPGANGASATLPHPTPPVEALLFGAGMISADQLGDLVRDAAISQQPVASVALERGLVTTPMLRSLLEQAGVDPSSVPGVPEESTGWTPDVPAPLETPAPAPMAPAAEELSPAPSLAFEPPIVLPVPAPDVTAAAAAAVAAAAPDAGVLVPLPNGHALETPSPEEPALRLAVEPVAEAPVAEAAPSVPEITFEPAAPAAAPAPAPVEAEQLEQFLVLVRLQGGERVVAGSAAGFEAATSSARSLAGLFAGEGDWPLVGGRYIRPQGVVSVDVEPVPGA